jgi:para-nitrobenzyl esterase
LARIARARSGVPHGLRLAATCGVLIAIAMFGCSREPEPPTPDPVTERSLSSGDVVGFVSENGSHAWRGIPFALAPVGDLRWRAPRPPTGWAGLRDATTHGSACVQYGGPMAGSGRSGEPAGQEDCLYLNVHAPAMTADAAARLDEPLPVMLWIHGGGNTIGSANVYDGSVLAASQSVIVVSVNYRLGVLGWFSHPVLHARDEFADDRSGNYGTLDLVRALDWVRDEIGAFGGDPSRVTIFGESAGGRNVFTLLVSPRAKGLFHRAIVQSGGLRTTSVDAARNPLDAESPGHAMSSAEVTYQLLERSGRVDDRAAAGALVDAMTTQEVADLLRGTPAHDLLQVFDGDRRGGMYVHPGIVRDGSVMPEEDPLSRLESGDYNRVPVIVGSNRDEVRLFALMESGHVTRIFGIPLWANDERRYLLETEYPSLMWKATGVDEPASAMRAAQGPSVYAYRFDWDEEPKVLATDFSLLLGAAHGLEVPFVFGVMRLFGAEALVFDDERLPAAKELASNMMGYWGQFAWMGDPGHGSSGRLPRWLPWDDSSQRAPRYLLLDTMAGGGIRMSSDDVSRETVIARIAEDDRFQSASERCALYREFVQRSRTMSAADYERVGEGECRAFPLDG